MAKLGEITFLFARLASNLETLNPTVTNESEPNDPSILNLTQSLNLTTIPRVRVLDTALSVMCFTAPQVFDSMNEYLVKTIITVLSSSVDCKVLRFCKDEILLVGGSISSRDRVEVIESCANVLGKLEGNGMLSRSLLYAVIKVAISASHYQYPLQLQLTPILHLRSDGRTLDFSKLLCHLPKEISLKGHEIPLRLLMWYLDSLILKHDVSQILHDSIKRPFLCLNTEFYERMEWRSILICLVVSPAVFIETRALLHKWFLVTGLASVLELQTKLVSLMLDVISRPMWWGISAEVGFKLPFSQAYFTKHQFLRTLTGPLSCENLLHLVCIIGKPVSHARRPSDPTLRQIAMNSTLVDHKSMWSMAMNFPDWFFFASVLLFSSRSFQDNFHSQCTYEASESEQSRDVIAPCSVAAARYIAWILNPMSESGQDLLVDCLTEISGSWTLKQRSSDVHKATSGYKKGFKRHKIHGKEDHSSHKRDSERILIWLRDFQDMYDRYCKKAVFGFTTSEVKTSQKVFLKQNVWFRKIPLGILIGSRDCTNIEGCELLLHYAATGTIHQPMEIQIAGLDQRRCNKKDAVAGARLVFHLTDITENISASILDTEHSEVDFICQVKLKAGNYLIKCVKRLLQLKIDGHHLIERDLHDRLVRWRHQGQDVFKGNNDMDDAIDSLSDKLSSL